MKKNIFTILIGIILILSVIPMLSAVPPVTEVQQFTEGYQIKVPATVTLKQFQDYEFEFHVHNISNGVAIVDKTICYFHLYNSSGRHQWEATDATVSHDFDYSFLVDGGNFSELGDGYYYNIYCASPQQAPIELAGHENILLQVTPNGNPLDVAHALLFFFILGLVGVFLFFSLSGVKNSTSGAVMIAYICLSYILIYALIGICYLITHDYLWANLIIENILYIVWFIMGIGFLPFVIVITLYILGQEARAVLEKDYMAQGHSQDEAKKLSKKHKR